MNGVIEVIRSDPLVRERATIRARPSLGSMALNVKIIRIRNILPWVVGFRRVLVVKMAKRAKRARVSKRVSKASRVGRSRVRWRRKVKKSSGNYDWLKSGK